MNESFEWFLESIRRINFILQKNPQKRWYKQTTVSIEKGLNSNDCLAREINKNQPLMVSRLGTSELHILLNFLTRDQTFYLKLKNYFSGIYPEYWWGKYAKNDISQNSGFFPTNEESLNRLVNIFLKDLPNIDVLLSWINGEQLLEKRGYLIKNILNLSLFGCEPYFTDNPWTLALRNKKVLVIHPFEDSIKVQYTKRELLFKQEVLPEFYLSTIKAVQSIDGHDSGFDSWFDALENMKQQIAEKDFDIALIAAGAYGLPLAAYVKSLGKQGIHLGGFL